ncbi:hypothetical protein D3C76_1839170 [compost metagenome]
MITTQGNHENVQVGELREAVHPRAQFQGQQLERGLLFRQPQELLGAQIGQPIRGE